MGPGTTSTLPYPLAVFLRWILKVTNDFATSNEKMTGSWRQIEVGATLSLQCKYKSMLAETGSMRFKLLFFSIFLS